MTEINIPDGYEINKEKSTSRKIILNKVKEYSYEYLSLLSVFYLMVESFLEDSPLNFKKLDNIESFYKKYIENNINKYR